MKPFHAITSLLAQGMARQLPLASPNPHVATLPFHGQWVVQL